MGGGNFLIPLIQISTQNALAQPCLALLVGKKTLSRKGLPLWLSLINGVLAHLAHKCMARQRIHICMPLVMEPNMTLVVMHDITNRTLFIVLRSLHL